MMSAYPRSHSGAVLAAMLSVAFLVSSCRPTYSPLPDLSRAAFEESRSLIHTYGDLTDATQAHYLTSLSKRLTGGRGAYSVRVVDSHEPLALSFGGGVIIVSRGIVLRTPHEGAFAFILAHEMAHELYAHSQELLGFTDESARTARHRALELEADRSAYGMVVRAGYDPRVALDALAYTYAAESMQWDSVAYPDFKTRIREIQKLLVQRWMPGIVDRREFRRFQASVRSARRVHHSGLSSD